MINIKQCFRVILSGDKGQSRAAARQVRKVLYRADYGSKYQDIKQQVNTAPKQYAEIKEGWRQENFVMAISVIYFLHDKEQQPDFLFSWLIDELLQHGRGNIRYAAVRMLTHEIGPLTVHIRHPGSRYSRYELKPEQADSILYALAVSLNLLAARLHKPIYNRYKYIDSLPSGPYKSVQMVLARLEEDCGQGYFDRLERRWTPGRLTRGSGRAPRNSRMSLRGGLKR